MNTQEILTIVQLGLGFGNLAIMIYALTKFLARPHESLNNRVVILEKEVSDIKDSLKLGNTRFKEQYSTNEVIIKSLLALIEFEIQYCITENKQPSKDLEHAKEELHAFLSRRMIDNE